MNRTTIKWGGKGVEWNERESGSEPELAEASRPGANDPRGNPTECERTAQLIVVAGVTVEGGAAFGAEHFDVAAVVFDAEEHFEAIAA